MKNDEYKLLEQIKEKFQSELVTVNGKTYISIDIFEKVLRESMVYEAILGSYIKNNGELEVSDNEILSYIASEDYIKKNIIYNNEKYTIL